MHRSMFRRLLTALSMAALLAATPGRAETAPSAASPPATPSSPASATTPASDDDVDWLSIGAVAECRDGTFLHGSPSVHACAEHGGVRRWLRTHEQDLIP